jgi:hypothetical protein
MEPPGVVPGAGVTTGSESDFRGSRVEGCRVEGFEGSGFKVLRVLGF